LGAKKEKEGNRGKVGGEKGGLDKNFQFAKLKKPLAEVLEAGEKSLDFCQGFLYSWRGCTLPRLERKLLNPTHFGLSNFLFSCV